MASQVYSGNNQPSFTYTNSTGQNVRVVINYLRSSAGGTTAAASRGTISAGALSIEIPGDTFTIGRNLAFFEGSQTSGATGVALAVAGNNAYCNSLLDADFGRAARKVAGLPTELMLAPGEVFSISGGIRIGYNIVVIPEAG